MKNLYAKFAGLFACCVLIGLIFMRDTLSEKNSYNYSSNVATPEKFGISFKEVSDEYGLKIHHRLNYPFPKNHQQGMNPEVQIYFAITTAMAVTSLNNDEFPDLCLTLPEEVNGVRCFVNNLGKSFTDVTDEVGLSHSTPYLPSAILSADFNNDGLEDLLVIRYGSHSIFLKNKTGKFTESKNAWFSNAWGANLYDVNNDGLLDIFFANFYRPDDLTQNPIFWPYTGIGEEKNGGQNELWLNNSAGSFSQNTTIYNQTFKARTTGIGFADVNRDNKVELFEGNDFAVDRFYFQNESGNFIEKTDETMSFNDHGFSGMNSEFYDINHDGFLDLNVSNIVTPPFVGQKNLMWVWDPKENQFSEKSRDYGIDRCGFAWTGKFSDFNLDGQADLVLASGYYKTGEDKQSVMFLQAIRNATPGWWPKEFVPRKIEDLSLVNNSRPCLFMREGDSFVDIGASFKELDQKATRTLVTADFNNDGKMDIIFNVQGGQSRMYRNESQIGDRNWVGFEFFNKHGSRLNFGVNASLKDETGHVIEYFELNPANGFKAQSDYRKLIGLGSNNRKMVLVIHGLGNAPQEIKYEDIRLNAYNKIQIN